MLCFAKTGHFYSSQTDSGGRFGVPDLGSAEFPFDEQALYGHAVDRGAGGFGRRTSRFKRRTVFVAGDAGYVE
jgi:hypothetical protein